MNTPLQIILVPVPEIASNKRVKNRPPLYQPIRRENGQWPLNQPIPDAEARRALADARRAIFHNRSEVERLSRSPGP
jgi:hypothetical protein